MNYEFKPLRPSTYGKNRAGERIPLYSEHYLSRKNGQEWFTYIVQAYEDDLDEGPCLIK